MLVRVTLARIIVLMSGSVRRVVTGSVVAVTVIVSLVAVFVCGVTRSRSRFRSATRIARMGVMHAAPQHRVHQHSGERDQRGEEAEHGHRNSVGLAAKG
ncbi:hypothetical protein LzC2_17400 [Planctomycetes bacterium LzC2]|uniref:Secreted protein n=1 Tax=Alienimonas chondri TaxID=2681879 RepID=A0ABX1VEF3_9PLAN|nr:hypothetical protein [Alienimonas chondri]